MIDVQDLQLVIAEKLEAEWQMPEWRQKLQSYIAQLINENMDALLQLLYRLDVDEHKIRAALQETNGAFADELITNMIVERQVQKIASRKKYTKPNNTADIPEDEQW